MQFSRWPAMQYFLLIPLATVALQLPVFAADLPRAEAPVMKVGDTWRTESISTKTGLKEEDITRTITGVSPSQIEVSVNNRPMTMTPDTNLSFKVPNAPPSERKYLSFPMEVGKKWSFKHSFVSGSATVNWELDAEVVSYEKVRVAAGEFDAFRIEYKGAFLNEGIPGVARTRVSRTMRVTNWYAPAVRGMVKGQFDDGYNPRDYQLMEFQLQQ